MQSGTERQEYVRRLCVGGFLIALARASAPSRARWFDSYVRLSLERDAAELTRLRQRQALADVLGRLAGCTAQVLNVQQIADGLTVSWDTVESHVRLLEGLFLVSRLPAWGKALTARATGGPKIHVVDSGVAARLMRVSPAKLTAGDATAQTEFGHLVETFVVGELRKQASWLPEPATLGHWRTADAVEVDLVVETDDGRVVAFEVKATERVSGRDFRGLSQLRDRVGDRFIAGVALGLGTRSYTYSDRLHVMPIDRLWHTVNL
jgi:predicted AAA+ superfamily ATPase